MRLGSAGALALGTVALVAVCVGGFSLLSSMRALVTGESLWSKARANAVQHLRTHASGGQAGDYRLFVESLAGPAGDRAARLELDKPQPDIALVEAGLLAGENASDDMPGLIALYRYLRRLEFMQEAVSAWAEGDRLIERLEALGERIHAHVERGDEAAVMQPLLSELDMLEGRLGNVERYFLATLGRASHTVERWLAGTAVALGGLLLLGGALFVRRAAGQLLGDRRLLGEAEQRWDLAAEATGIGRVDWHVADDRFELDARAAALYGVGEGQGATLTGSALRGRTHADDLPFLRPGAPSAASAGGLFRQRYRILLPGDAQRHVEMVGRLRDTEVPGRARLLGILRDIDSEIAHARLIIDKEQAESRSRLRIDLLSRLGDELRTRLHGLLETARSLDDGGELLGADRAQRVRTVEERGSRLLRLVDDVLDITRIDAGLLEMRSVPTDVLHIARASLDSVEPERASSNSRIEDRMPRKASLVQADPRRLHQAFVTLLANALRHGPDGGLVSLGYREDERHALLSISHEGTGIGGEHASRLLEPLPHGAPAADAADTSDTADTGLELLVVKLLLDRMQAEITVHGAPGQGACFTVRLLRA